jgi:succinoglycan biosynthesis transport protein ExoP
MDQLIAILRTLSRHRYKLILLPLLAMGLVYYFTKGAPKVYRTDAKLYLNLQESKGLSLNGEDLKQYQVHSYFQNTIELFKSKKTIEKVQLKIVALALDNNRCFRMGNETLMKNKEVVKKRIDQLLLTDKSLQPNLFPDSLILHFLQKQQITTEELKGLITAYRILDSNFMKFELTEREAERTKLLADLFIEALVEENTQLSKSKVKGHKDIIEKLVKQAKLDLDEKIKRLENYKVSNSIINLGEHTKAIVVYLVQLEGQRATLLSKMASGSKGKVEVMDVVRNGNEVTLDLAGHEEILKLKKTLHEMNAKLLTTSFEKENTESFKIIQQNIEHAKSQVQFKLTELARKTPYDPSRVQLDLVTKYIGYDLEAETASHMIPVINSEIERVSKYANKFAPHESKIGAFDQDIATAQDVYITLLNKLNLTEAMEYGSAESVIEIIDPPFLPLKPEPSKQLLLIVAGGLSMFILVAGALIISQLVDATISSVEKFERYFSLPAVAALPLAANVHPLLQPSIELVHKQQLLKLANHIKTKCVSGATIMLSSTEKNEGKHYLATQLQNLFESIGKKVNIVDADWVNVQPNSFINLKSYFSGNGILFHESEIRNTISQLKKESDFVIIITAPINLSGENDFWLSVCDHILYLFKANRNRTKSDQRAEALFNSSPKHFLGAVINQLQIENMEDYLGEIPKQRSWLRIKLKSILSNLSKPTTIAS